MSRRGPRGVKGAPVAAVAAVLLLAGCGSDDDSGTLPVLGDGAAPTTVTAQTRDLTSVVTLDATVVASPTFVVSSPRAGTFRKTGTGGSGAVARLNGRGGAATITLPRGARLVRVLVADGATVPAGLPVLEAVYTGFAVRAEVPATRIYRFIEGIGSMRAQVTNGPGPFPCPALGSLAPAGGGAPAPGAGLEGGGPGSAGPGPGPDEGPDPTGGEASGAAAAVASLESGAGVVLQCATPGTLRLVPGSPALLAVTTGTAKDAVALPVEAVAGLSQQGVVAVTSGGKVEQRQVQLGITDGRYVQITTGLKAGDVVLSPAPSLGEGAP